MTEGSTMPLPTVAATFISNTITAAKLKVAAQITAWCGFRTLVETIVAIEFAASWKPLRKSNARARATRSTSVARPIDAVSIGPGSGVFEDDALDQLGDVLAPVGDRFEQLVDRLELDQLAYVGLLAKQPRHRRAHHPVGIRFDLVDLLAQAQDGVGVVHVVEHRDRARHPLATHLRQLRQLAGLGRGALQVVERRRFRDVLDQV